MAGAQHLDEQILLLLSRHLLFNSCCLACCSVNTPTKTRGVGAGKAADLTYWEGAARVIASVSKSSKIIVEKSTVPVKTADAIEKVGKWLKVCMFA